jgi:hypothetical protein
MEKLVLSSIKERHFTTSDKGGYFLSSNVGIQFLLSDKGTCIIFEFT